jgi:hypothetical protein
MNVTGHSSDRLSSKPWATHIVCTVMRDFRDLPARYGRRGRVKARGRARKEPLVQAEVKRLAPILPPVVRTPRRAWSKLRTFQCHLFWRGAPRSDRDIHAEGKRQISNRAPGDNSASQSLFANRPHHRMFSGGGTQPSTFGWMDQPFCASVWEAAVRPLCASRISGHQPILVALIWPMVDATLAALNSGRFAQGFRLSTLTVHACPRGSTLTTFKPAAGDQAVDVFIPLCCRIQPRRYPASAS